MNAQLLPIVLSSLLAVPPTAQSDSIPYNPAEPVFSDSYIVVHDSGEGVQAFSALTQDFTMIAAAGNQVIDVKDWGAMVVSGTGQIAVYSARTNVLASVPLQAGEVINSSRLEDDVAFITTTLTDGTRRLHGFSMQLSTWATISIGIPDQHLNWAMSRFVIGVRDITQGVHRLSCFSARQGVWVQQSFDDVRNLMADGNVFACTVEDNSIEKNFAFSGVHGVGKVSPEALSGAFLTIDHNMAYTRVREPNSMWKAAAYSAYTGRWVSSSRVRALGGTSDVLLGDNYVALTDDPNNAANWEIIGARPHQQWAQLGVASDELSTSEDSLVVATGSNSGLYAFSGLANGTWIFNNRSGPYQSPTSGDHLNVVLEVNRNMLAFSPPRASWSPLLLQPSGGALLVFGSGDAVCLVEAVDSVGDVILHGYNVRSNDWLSLPMFDQISGATGGSVSIIQEDNNDDTWAYDTRRLAYVARPGSQDGDLHAGRNLTLQVESNRTYGFSHQRGGWDLILNRFGSPAGTNTISVGPMTEENVAWMVDGAGELVAYSSVADLQSIFQYPDGTEYYALADVGDSVAPTPVRLTSRVQPGILRQYLSLFRAIPPITLPAGLFSGQLHIVSPYLINNRVVFGIYAFDEIPLPPSPPLNLPFWLQNLCTPVPFQAPPLVAGEDPEVLWLF